MMTSEETERLQTFQPGSRPGRENDTHPSESSCEAYHLNDGAHAHTFVF